MKTRPSLLYRHSRHTTLVSGGVPIGSRILDGAGLCGRAAQGSLAVARGGARNRDVEPRRRMVLSPRRDAHPFTVSAHEPDAKMSKRRLGNLPRTGDITFELDTVIGGHRDRIGGQSLRLDRHTRRGMEDEAKPAVFLDVEIAARIIPAHHPSRPRPVSCRLDAAIGAEKPIPEIIDYREIAIGMAVVDKMEVLLLSEPGKAPEP